MLLAAHRQLAQQFAARQRACLALAQAVLDDAKSTTPELLTETWHRDTPSARLPERLLLQSCRTSARVRHRDNATLSRDRSAAVLHRRSACALFRRGLAQVGVYARGAF